MDIILASASPRRRQLLEQIGIKNFTISPSSYEEPFSPGNSPEASVSAIALAKALDVASRSPANSLIIAADTLVFLNGKPLGKPADADDARTMLRCLSGREHSVVTGLAVLWKDKRSVSAETTLVRFLSMTDSEIDWYISTGEPMDKAGGYGIQGFGAMFIEGIKGDYFNVMGLPLARLTSELKKMGIRIPDLIG